MNTPTATSMFESEAAQIPALLARQAQRLPPLLKELVARLDRLAPTLIATVARGSSDNAAAFAGYAAVLGLGLPVASLPPSVASVYGRTLRLERAVALAISQSGASPDLVLTARAARSGGALTVGLINEQGSALAREVEFEIQIDAGPERAIAATKTFMLSVSAALHLIAAWNRDAPLHAALAEFPETLERCKDVDCTIATRVLAGREHVFVVGRGPALPVAKELALKLEEVSGLPADAQSAAELLHGPISMASPRMVAIVLAGDRHSRESVRAATARLYAAGVAVLLLAPESEPADGGEVIHVPEAGHELLQPLVSLYAMYPVLAQLARQRGRDPDRPPHLEKTTLTR